MKLQYIALEVIFISVFGHFYKKDTAFFIVYCYIVRPFCHFFKSDIQIFLKILLHDTYMTNINAH